MCAARIVVIGYGNMFANLILGCIEGGHEVVGVFRHERVTCSPLKLFFKDIFFQSTDFAFIKSLNLHEIKARSVNRQEFADAIVKLRADIVLVASWSEKLKKHAIILPKIACVNCHPSLLPKYRGPNPYIHVIKNREVVSGVTFHLLDDNYDSGAVLLQKEVSVMPYDTGRTLKTRCTIAAREGVKELTAALCSEIVIPLEQNEKNATYYPQINHRDVIIDLTQNSDEISAHIRGFIPWQKCYFHHNGQIFEIGDFEIIENTTAFKKPGTVALKKDCSVGVTLSDGKIMLFNNLKLLGRLQRPFTKFYVKNFIKLGDSLA